MCKYCEIQITKKEKLQWESVCILLRIYVKDSLY
jgi:hypothetical protein